MRDKSLCTWAIRDTSAPSSSSGRVADFAVNLNDLGDMNFNLQAT